MLRRRQIARHVWLGLCIVLLAGAVLAQSKPTISITETQQGLRIGASGGVLPNARVLRLSNPDRLVLDFDQTDYRVTAAERNVCATHGVRLGYHAETATTRVVFDIPAGQQRWMKLEREAVLVEYRSLVHKGGSATEIAAIEPPVRAANPPQAQPATVAATTHARAPRTEKARSQSVSQQEGTRLNVTSSDGLLQVSARGVPFKAILDKVAEAAGASVQMMTPVQPGQAEIFEFGPAPPMEVIRKLFEGSNYNYLVISEPNSTTRISRIMVTSALRYLPGNDGPVADDDSNPESLQGITPIAPKPTAAEEKPPN